MASKLELPIEEQKQQETKVFLAKISAHKPTKSDVDHLRDRCRYYLQLIEEGTTPRNIKKYGEDDVRRGVQGIVDRVCKMANRWKYDMTYEEAINFLREVIPNLEKIETID